MEEEKLNRISTDVLIIGSGGAGLRTAIETRRLGANVLLVSKSKTGLATCTASAGGIFRVSEKEMEEHFKQTIEAGRFLNRPDLVKILVSEGWNAVKELESFGIKLLIEKDKTSVIAERFPAGATLSRGLSNYALSLGAKVLEKTIVFDLLVEEDRCLGALAFKRDSGEVIDISAKAVVLATGGYAGLYVRNDNPPTMTGDGLALAFKAGAKLQDLEFVQFQPMFIDVGVPRMPILDWLIEATKNLVSGGSLVNNKGERFLAKYGLLEQEILRDNLTVAFEREILEDKSHKDSVVFDLRSLSSEEIEEAFDLEYQKSLVRPFTHILANRQLHVASTAHYTMGGVRINEHCETGIEGLYAVGEVTSGIHGANRLGGNALTEIMVFGKIAGQQAAKYAENAHFATIDEKRAKESERILQEFRSRTRNRKVNPSLVKSNVRTVVSNFCKPVRSREGLKRAEIELEQTEENASLMFAENSFQLKEAVEAQFMLALAKLIVKSASARKESRGAHFRLDYPKCDDERWLKNIIVGQEEGKTTIRFEAVTHE